VEILDMRGGSGRGGPLHPRTIGALREVGRRGGKAIVLINRRGWSPHLECRSCGRTWTCERCDVSLVLHRGGDSLRCHHCGHAERPPGSCPDCGSVTLARHGAGTERVSSLLEEALDGLPVFRLDSDSAAPSGHGSVLSAFDRADAGVLVGTQMVAKGHDFPEVTLGVVLDADATLRFPDFRAEERTFSLVTQLAGRSGRGEAGGCVLVQTLAPDAECIRAAARHDAAGFLASELERRRALSYPPFAHLVRIELAATDDHAVERAAERLAARIGPELPADASMLGPAPRLRLRGRNRRQLLIKAQTRSPTVDAVRAAVEAAAGSRELRAVSLAVDVDPQ
jgi:primosomal protein N' (replication factor Y)